MTRLCPALNDSAPRYGRFLFLVPDGDSDLAARLPHHLVKDWCSMAKGTCASEGCDSPVLARSMCSAHYQQWRKRADPAVFEKTPQPPKQCSAKDCVSPAHARGLCTGHYKRQVAGLLVDVPLKVRRKSGEAPPPCSADECDNPSRHCGLCDGHYQRFRSGTPLDGPLRPKRKNGEPAADCSFPDCGRPVKYKQLCKTHYECQRMGLPLIPIRDLMPRVGTCAAPDCDRGIWSRGLCSAHYVRVYYGTSPDRPIRPRSPNGQRQAASLEQILGPRRKPGRPKSVKVVIECGAPDCDRPAEANGLCGAHRVRKYYDVPLEQPIRRRRPKGSPVPACSVDDCAKPATGGFGLCKTHWASQTGKGAEYSARRRSRKFAGPHEHISAADYRALRAATDTCYLCGGALAAPVEFDHVIPLARGGCHVLANIKPTHRRCNRVKWASLPPEVVAAESMGGGDAEV